MDKFLLDTFQRCTFFSALIHYVSAKRAMVQVHILEIRGFPMDSREALLDGGENGQITTSSYHNMMENLSYVQLYCYIVFFFTIEIVY